MLHAHNRTFRTTCIPLPVLIVIFTACVSLSCLNSPNPDGGDAVFQLSFTPEEAEASVTRLIDDARESIYIALYEFDNESVSKALVDAHRRGVAIQAVTDYDSEKNASWQELTLYRIPLVLANSNGIMHNKYFIIDMKYLVTGSTNFSKAMVSHFNNMIIIKSPGLAADYKRDFDVLFGHYSSTQKDDGFDALYNPPPLSLTDWPEQAHQIGPFMVQAFFTPYKKSFPSYNYSAGVTYSFYNYDDNNPDDEVTYKSALNIIIPLIRNAREKVHMLCFAFTDRVIAHELIQAKLRGCDVRLWMDYNQYASSFNNSGHTFLALREQLGPDRAKLCRRPDGGLLHHKVIMVDSEALILGSLNFSDSAVSSNDENFLVIHNAGAMIGEFELEARRIDKVSHPIPPLP